MNPRIGLQIQLMIVLLSFEWRSKEQKNVVMVFFYLFLISVNCKENIFNTSTFIGWVHGLDYASRQQQHCFLSSKDPKKKKNVEMVFLILISVNWKENIYNTSTIIGRIHGLDYTSRQRQCCFLSSEDPKKKKMLWWYFYSNSR